MFNGFFTSVASSLVDKLPQPSGRFSCNSNHFTDFCTQKGLRPDSFKLSPVTLCFIMKELKSLNHKQDCLSNPTDFVNDKFSYFRTSFIIFHSWTKFLKFLKSKFQVSISLTSIFLYVFWLWWMTEIRGKMTKLYNFWVMEPLKQEKTVDLAFFHFWLIKNEEKNDHALKKPVFSSKNYVQNPFFQCLLYVSKYVLFIYDVKIGFKLPQQGFLPPPGNLFNGPWKKFWRDSLKMF